jgi:Mn-containing catalase
LSGNDSTSTPQAESSRVPQKSSSTCAGVFTSKIAELQYWVQSFHVENVDIRDMLQDIAIEEFSHLEMVGKLTAQHTSELDQTSLHDAPLLNLKGGGPHFLDSQGSCWTAAYIQEGGNIVRDLRANNSAEAGARQTYES